MIHWFISIFIGVGFSLPLQQHKYLHEEQKKQPNYNSTTNDKIFKLMNTENNLSFGQSTGPSNVIQLPLVSPPKPIETPIETTPSPLPLSLLPLSPLPPLPSSPLSSPRPPLPSLQASISNFADKPWLPQPNEESCRLASDHYIKEHPMTVYEHYQLIGKEKGYQWHTELCGVDLCGYSCDEIVVSLPICSYNWSMGCPEFDPPPGFKKSSTLFDLCPHQCGTLEQPIVSYESQTVKRTITFINVNLAIAKEAIQEIKIVFQKILNTFEEPIKLADIQISFQKDEFIKIQYMIIECINLNWSQKKKVDEIMNDILTVDANGSTTLLEDLRHSIISAFMQATVLNVENNLHPYTMTSLRHCKNNMISTEQYFSIASAIAACDANSMCSGVYDPSCDGISAFYLCDRSAWEYSSEGSCIRSSIYPDEKHMFYIEMVLDLIFPRYLDSTQTFTLENAFKTIVYIALKKEQHNISMSEVKVDIKSIN